MNTKNKFFYNTADINRMKILIRTGKPLIQIAEEQHESFGAPLKGFYTKLCKVAKHTTKVRQWEGPKIIRRKKIGKAAVVEPQGINVPEGVSLDFTSKRVIMHKDHVRIYF
jgi:hypothetical protein